MVDHLANAQRADYPADTPQSDQHADTIGLATGRRDFCDMDIET